MHSSDLRKVLDFIPFTEEGVHCMKVGCYFCGKELDTIIKGNEYEVAEGALWVRLTQHLKFDHEPPIIIKEG